jgi:hypothetical protein
MNTIPVVFVKRAALTFSLQLNQGAKAPELVGVFNVSALH